MTYNQKKKIPFLSEVGVDQCFITEIDNQIKTMFLIVSLRKEEKVN